MADQLYLSLWFPDFHFDSLPGKLLCVMRQFARIAGHAEDGQVEAATAYPFSFNEAPAWQRVYVNDDRAETTEASTLERALAEATEQFHEDMAYEFELKWNLWTPETSAIELDPIWRKEPATVRIIGFGPEFDEASSEQNGHIRVDFGLDTPWVMDDSLNDIDEDAQKRIQQNVEMLLAFTLSVEKHCGISSRLLWTESGEPLAEKLIARLQRLN
ncbi:MAG: hypothetical protein FWD64_08625 [Acidobacteriaceae bacterium]|nr:hypothetical protein [Acidobacteriaceae bacterium]